jgi:hypothetical protein
MYWFLVAVFILLPGIASYVVFHPYADDLKSHLLFGLAGFPAFYAIVGTAMLGQPAGAIPLNFVILAIPLLIVVAVLYFAERRIRRS